MLSIFVFKNNHKAILSFQSINITVNLHINCLSTSSVPLEVYLAFYARKLGHTRNAAIMMAISSIGTTYVKKHAPSLSIINIHNAYIAAS